MVAAIESDGFDSPAAAAARAKIRLAGDLELLVLFAVVFAMVAKPGL